MGLVITSVVINTLVSLVFLAGDSVPSSAAPVSFMVFLVLVVFSLVGSIQYEKTGKKGWGFLAGVCFAAFAPIGLIGVFGLKRIARQHEEERLREEEDEQAPEVKFVNGAR